ncbi:MAG: glycerate kinase type-2 family protein [Telluria sp.]
MAQSLTPRELLLHLFERAVAAVDPAAAIAPFLPAPPRGRTVVVGAGKGSARMAAGLERLWNGPLEGVVVTRYGHGADTRAIEVIEAGHPVPDEASELAARRILAAVQGLGPDDLVIALMSGGGSALLSLPAPGLPAAEKRDLNRALLRCGAPIGAINCVRRHLSAIKGGRLALACHPARVVTLVVSDVPDDDPAVVASGPTVPDGTRAADARALLERYGLPLSPAVAAVLANPALAAPLPDDPRLARNSVHVVATAQVALEAAAAAARAAGITPLILSSSLEGEAREVALVHAALARQARAHGQPAAPPCVLLSGGETSVTVRGKGRGGRNTEFLLALALALGGARGIHALACDTDGIDGSEDNAGALLDPSSLARSRLDPRELLANNDAYSFFEDLGDLVITGPTCTNVNDFRAIYVEAIA